MPEQTAEAFKARLKEGDEGPFLRTGDLGLLADGELYISGRLKNMLILRGMNYYAEDIEQAVEAHFPVEQIGRCAAFSIVQETREQLVIALEVQRHMRSANCVPLLSEIRSLVAGQFGVQVYAIALVKLNGIPKTSSGKLQRTQCQSAFLDGTLPLVTSEVYGVAEAEAWTEEPALTQAELLEAPLEVRPSLLLAFLRQVLARTLHLVLTESDSERSLHALGCDSLTLIELKNTLEEQLGLKLALTTLFSDLTLTQLASSLCGAIEHDMSVPEPVLAISSELAEFPLSAGQRALWFLHQLYPESAAYNVSFALQFQQPLDEERMSKSLQELVKRHPSLRAHFGASQGQPFQQVLAAVPLAVEQRVLAREDEQTWASVLEEEVQIPFDLEHGPLFRVSLWLHPSGKSLLLFVAHHIVVDFRSLVQIACELLTVYQGRSFVAVPPPSRYANYVFWQEQMLRGERGEQLRRYWSERLRGAQTWLELPCDRARPATQTFNGVACPFVLSPELSRQLKTLAFPYESLEAFVAILAVLKVGATYVPLDLAYPSERLAFIISDADLVCVLTLSICHAQLEGAGKWELFVYLDKIVETLLALPDTPLTLPGGVHPDQLAYIIYTSGLTGTPNGVGCSHRNVLNNITDFARRWEIYPGHRWSLWTSITFDHSAFEIFLPLVTGGTLLPLPEEVRIDPALCFAWLDRQRIHGGYLPPFLLASLNEWLEKRHGSKPALDLRYLLVGVEPIPEQVLLALLRQLPALHILNGYGPAEATICTTLYEPGKPQEYMRITPIGRPMQNVVLHVLDELLQPVPSGVVGELYLGGASLACGYIGRADLTAERFIPHPWSRQGGERLYRTGDLVRWLPEGQLIFVGRADRQLKFHGFRIEPGEIESRLALHPAIREALVLHRQDQRGQEVLVACLVSSHEGEQASIEDLRSWLRQYLPEYMVPAFFLWLGCFPVTVNGKIDQRALQALPLPDTRHSLKGDEPRTPLEAELVALWAELLEVESVGIHEDFFMLGGHSLLAMQLVARVRSRFHVELPLHQLFEYPTIAGLAGAIEHEREAGSDEPKLVVRARTAYRVSRSSLLH